MRSPAVFWWSLVLLVSACGAARAADAPAPADPARALLREFFASEDKTRRAALANQFAAVAPKSWADLRMMLHETAGRPPLKAGRLTLEAPADNPLPAVKYVLRVPRNYKGDERQGWPLVIGCHEMGGSAETFLGKIEDWLGPDVEKYLVAVAQDPQAGGFGPDRPRSQYPLRVLDDLRHRANIDSNRTILVGRSKGGFAAWGSVLFAPGQWAGLVAVSAFPLTNAGSYGATIYLPNVLNLSVQTHWGENDIEPGQKQGISTLSRDVMIEMKNLGATKFEGIPYAAQGHDVQVIATKARALINAAVRDPFPEQCRMVFHKLWQGADYYVRALTADRPEFDFAERREVHVEGEADIPRAFRAFFVSQAYELSLRLAPATNTLTLFARGIREIEVELSAEKLDFRRPIKIILNGRTVTDEPRKLDWVELLETVRRTGDFERLVGGRLKLTATATPEK
jgi:hypothetical protein